MRKTVIEFSDFSFQYRAQAKPTLKNINLKIYEGEKVLIVGPSGCGKSTISNCINGLVPFKYEGKIDGSLKINNKESKLCCSNASAIYHGASDTRISKTHPICDW